MVLIGNKEPNTNECNLINIRPEYELQILRKMGVKVHAVNCAPHYIDFFKQCAQLTYGTYYKGEDVISMLYAVSGFLGKSLAKTD